MSTRKISSVAGIATTAVLLILVAVSATAATTTISSYAQTIPSIFHATLEGEEEVPPVDSDAKGLPYLEQATMELNSTTDS